MDDMVVQKITRLSKYFSYVPSSINCVRHDGSFFSMLWPDIIQLGRVTSDVITGMSVTQSVRGWALNEYSTFLYRVGGLGIK